MSGNNKKIVSMRISENDHLKIKRIAKRLEVRDSDIIRFAIKMMLSKLSPLDRQDRSGKELLPAFIETGKELTSFFNLDADKLENIINSETALLELQVDISDIELIAMSALSDNLTQRKIKDLINNSNFIPDGSFDIKNILREYLYEKYLRSTG